jgi:hypothetical protein
MFANIFVGARLRERQGKFYGITLFYRKNPRQFRENLPRIFALLVDKKVGPLINRSSRFGMRDLALELLAGGSIEGKIVLSSS